MPNHVNKHILIVGTGPMALAYFNALKYLNNLNITVIGRGFESCKKFKELTGVQPYVGGVENYLFQNPSTDQDYFIIAVGTEILMHVLLQIVKCKFKRVLIEKPAAISIQELLAHQIDVEHVAQRIYVGYNRRYYDSVLEAQRIIEEDGGLVSMHFDFTEWVHRIEKIDKKEGVKENWFFANSTHVADLAFYLAGNPSEWNTFVKNGSLSWHPKSVFCGAGVTHNEVLFSYMSNWESGGRWSIELTTNNRKLILRPLEELWILEKGELESKKAKLPTVHGENLKAGILSQVESFIGDSAMKIPNILEHINSTQLIFNRMLNP
ncbi:MAG: Gfo/Idh/MocA family oxidoreductase [Cyclobacteriaceae bacterium]|jgi:predicted dehydrogenase